MSIAGIMSDNKEDRRRKIEALATAKYENFTLICKEYLWGMNFSYCIDLLRSALSRVQDKRLIPVMRLYLGYYGYSNVKASLIEDLSRFPPGSVEYIARLVALANLGAGDACRRLTNYLKSQEREPRETIIVIAGRCSNFHEFESADQIIACLEQMISNE